MSQNELESIKVQEKDGVLVEHVERKSSPSADPVMMEDGELLAMDVRPAAERELVRKLDMRLLPTIIVIFIMNYIDRTAVTSAKLKGLTQDLGLTDIQYATVLAVLYASYVPAQIPSNMILNRISRHPAFPLTVKLYINVVDTQAILLYTRLCRHLGPHKRSHRSQPKLCGDPPHPYLRRASRGIELWQELAFRSAILYGGLLISNAFGSLMAAGILSRMEGKLGIRAWRWLFYIEGSITICLGFFAVFLLPDYVRLTSQPASRRLAQVRLAEDAGEADEDSSTESAFTGLIMALKDPKVPIFALMSCAQLLGLGFVNFFPTIAGTLGFSTTITLVLAAPPWIVATFVCCLNAWHADKTGERYFHICVPWWGVIVGYIIGVTTMSIGGRYVAMFLMASGYAGFALTLVWVSNAVPRPPAKRSAAIGIVNGFGNLGNLISSYVWKASWAPNYHQSMLIGLSGLVLSSALALVIRCMLVRQNARLEREELENLKGARRERIEEAARLEGISFEEALERKKGFSLYSLR
ncbi:hypothetical protein A0H81_10482 [Grifola frondosa]|uniref:MFS general substrate transporter n=1 Tax=Grifola frondosa TaxID=5627 RepID=A0A1C7M016_GRIFR|nr:hypothetical protein A0H81_10482 [Grifola frondosa]